MDSAVAGNSLLLNAMQMAGKPISASARLSPAGSASGSDGQLGTVRRPRFGMPKVRTGCTVCKIRRVKCDETKPSCIRCTSTGRTCEGYLPALPRKPRRRNAAPSHALIAAPRDASYAYDVFELLPVSPCHPPVMNAIEHESFSFFWTVSESDVSRNFGPNFWGRLVLQASREHPTVRYALDAVIAMYEAYTRLEHTSHRSQDILDTPMTRAALVCYNRAVTLISSDLSAGVIPLEAVLICCLLFVWLEFLRNDFVTGMKHLRSGLAILLENPARLGQPGSASTALDESIPHIFTRLQIQATLHGCPSSDFNSSPMKCPSDTVIDPRPQAFATLAEARYSLDSRLIYIFQFVREKQAFEASRGFQVTSCAEWSLLIDRRDMYITELIRWNAAFRHSPLMMTEKAESSAGFLLLMLNFEVALMVLKGLFFDSEMQYDEFNEEFKQMLNLSEKILQRGPPKGQLPVLSLDTGVIPTLCYTILKCRERTIRYRAMEALKRAPEREGMWHRDSIIAVTSWKVALEERLAARMVGADPGPLPSHARIYRERVQDATTGGKAASVRFDGGPTGYCGTEWEINGLLSRFGDVM